MFGVQTLYGGSTVLALQVVPAGQTLGLFPQITRSSSPTVQLPAGSHLKSA
jgi:hypothetical protein